MNSKYADSLITLKNSKREEIPAYPHEAVVMALEEIGHNYNEIK